MSQTTFAQALNQAMRDAMTQERVALDQVSSYLGARLLGC